jgi:hypothetical protein
MSRESRDRGRSDRDLEDAAVLGASLLPHVLPFTVGYKILRLLDDSRRARYEAALDTLKDRRATAAEKRAAREYLEDIRHRYG